MRNSWISNCKLILTDLNILNDRAAIIFTAALFVLSFCSNAQTNIVVYDTIQKNSFQDYQLYQYKQDFFKTFNSPINNETFRELVSTSDSLFINTNFEMSIVKKNKLRNDTLFIKREQKLNTVFLNNKSEFFTIKSFGNKDCKRHLNSDYYFMAFLSDTINNARLNSVSFYFQKSKREMFKAKTPKNKRFKLILFGVDSLKVEPHTNKNLVYQSEIKEVHPKFKGWYEIDLTREKVKIFDYKYLVIGIKTMDFNVVLPCYNNFEKRNDRFITLVKQTEYLDNGKIRFNWVQHSDKVKFPNYPPTEILPVILNFEK